MAYLELNGWDTGIKFSASHFIPGHAKCGRLHGHVYGVRVKIHGEIGKDHMVMDFLELKRWLRDIVEELDHHVLVPSESPGIHVSEDNGECTVTANGKRYVFPKEDVVLLPIPLCSAEEMAQFLLKRCVGEIPFPQNVTRVELALDEGTRPGRMVCTGYEKVNTMVKKGVVLLSGGLDSATVCAIASKAGYRLVALTFLYGQRHEKEIECAKAIGEHYGVKHHVFANVDLGQLGGSSLTEKDAEIPTHTEEEIAKFGIPTTYVPARNTIFLSYALAVAETTGADEIFIGTNAVDYSGYPDCRPEYIHAFQQMANLAIKRGVEGDPVMIRTPLMELSKGEIITWGSKLSVPYAKTWSCYSGKEQPCGVCDSCKLRAKGFQKAGMKDPALEG